jgi:hypothetical protein
VAASARNLPGLPFQRAPGARAAGGGRLMDIGAVHEHTRMTILSPPVFGLLAKWQTLASTKFRLISSWPSLTLG